jgi:hypothetical protein
VKTFQAVGVQHPTLSLVHPGDIEMLAPVVEGLRR